MSKKVHGYRSKRILIACEYSGTVRDAFIEAGHNAWSCDIIPDEGFYSDKHYTGDIVDSLSLGGFFNEIEWDLIIAHPPCTAIAVSGNRHYGRGKPKHDERLLSIRFIEKLWELCTSKSPRVCFENPVGVIPSMTKLPSPQYINPWMFGHMEQKKTGLWLHNLPELKETNNVYEEMMLLPKKEIERIFYMSPGKDRGKLRSKFYKGIAEAMVEQWGTLNECTITDN